PIRTRRKVRKYIGSGFVADGCSRNSSARLSCSDLDTRQDCAARIFDSAADFRRRLRPQAGASEKRNHQYRSGRNDNAFHVSSNPGNTHLLQMSIADKLEQVSRSHFWLSSKGTVTAC